MTIVVRNTPVEDINSSTPSKGISRDFISQLQLYQYDSECQGVVFVAGAYNSQQVFDQKKPSLGYIGPFHTFEKPCNQ